MEITDRRSAAQWLAAWDGKPRRGVKAAAVDGLRMCAGISRTYGRPLEAADYDAAADLIATA